MYLYYNVLKLIKIASSYGVSDIKLRYYTFHTSWYHQKQYVIDKR